LAKLLAGLYLKKHKQQTNKKTPQTPLYLRAAEPAYFFLGGFLVGFRSIGFFSKPPKL